MNKPLTITEIPNSIFEIVNSRAEMINPTSDALIYHAAGLPHVTLGTDIEITELELYEIHNNTDDELISDEFDLTDYDDNGTIHYKAKSSVLDSEIYGKTLYYLVNGTKYTHPFKVCEAEYSLRLSHKSSKAFGLYNSLIYDTIAFYASQIKDDPQSSTHQVVKRNGISFTSESYLHEWIEIKAYVPYYMVRKLHQAQFFDTLKLVIGSGVGAVVYTIESMTFDLGGGDRVREITLKILPEVNVQHYEYNETGVIVTPATPHTVEINGVAGVLGLTITGGSGHFNILWLKDGIQVGSGSTYDAQNIAGQYEAIVLDTDTGINANDGYGIANLCENFSVSHVIENVLNSNNKLITITTNGTEPITYEWEYSEDNTTFTPLASTTNVLECEDSGYYKYIVTDDNGCQKIVTLQIFIATHTVTITRDSNTLTATVTGCSEATLQWYVNTGSGETIITGATDNELEIEENGYYTVKANCSGNIQTASYLVLDIGNNSFMVLISKVWDDSGTQKAYAEVINAPTTLIGLNWYQRKSSGWIQIGSGDTISITEIGFLKVIATDENGNAVIDELAQVTDPERLTLYNKFIISGSLEHEFTISGFTVPNPASLTENQINADWFATRGGIKLKFKNVVASSLLRDEYGIDYANNKIYISSTIKIYANEVIEFSNK